MACFVALHDMDQCDPSSDPAHSIMIDAEYLLALLQIHFDGCRGILRGFPKPRQPGHGEEDRSASDRPL